MCAEFKMYNHPILLSKRQIEDSLIQYDPIHLTTIDFEHIHLFPFVNQIYEMKAFLELLMMLVAIYYVISKIFNFLKWN